MFDRGVETEVSRALEGELSPTARQVIGLREIADLLQLPASSLTSMTDRLVREGLVERVTMPNDRRVVAATITDAGRELVERIEAINHRDLVTMLREVTDDDLGQFSSVLTHMYREFERTIVDRTVPKEGDADSAVAK